MDDNIINFNDLNKISIQNFRDPLHKSCEHKRLWIIRNSPYLECRDCGKAVDPVLYLTRIAEKETTAEYRYQQLKADFEGLMEKIKSQNKFHCEHCKKYSRIDRSIWWSRNDD
jgi:hypothetical protein